MHDLHHHKNIIFFDDGGHIKRYALHSEHCSQTLAAKQMTQLHIEMHFKGHVDAWCKKHFNLR